MKETILLELQYNNTLSDPITSFKLEENDILFLTGTASTSYIV